MDGVNAQATVDPLKPANGPSDNAIDFDDPSQAAPSKKEKSQRGNRRQRSEKEPKNDDKKESKSRESKEEAPASNGRRRQQQRPARGRRPAGRQAEADLADPDDGESAEDAYERVAQRMSERAGKRRRDDDDRGEGRRIDRDGSRARREEARREREDRNREREDRRSRSHDGEGRDEREYTRSRRPMDDRRSERETDFDFEDDLDDDDRDDRRDSRRDARSRRRDDDDFDDRRDRRESRRDERDDRDSRDDDDRISNRLLRQAMDEYGMTRGEALDYESATELESAMTKIDRQFAKAGQRERERLASEREQGADDAAARQEEGRRSADASPASKGADGRATDKKPAEGEPRFKKPDLSKIEGYDGFNNETKLVLNSIVDTTLEHANALDSENRELKKQVDWMMQRHREEAVRNWTESMDGFFEDIYDEYGDVFGKGPLEELDPDSDEAKNRTDFEEEMKSLILGRRLQGRDLSMKDAQRKALRLFARTLEKYDENIRSDATRKANRRRRMSIAPPSNRGGGRELSPDDAAADFADNFYRDHGYQVDRRVDDDDDWHDGV